MPEQSRKKIKEKIKKKERRNGGWKHSRFSLPSWQPFFIVLRLSAQYEEQARRQQTPVLHWHYL
jgi:hypothetical protein